MSVSEMIRAMKGDLACGGVDAEVADLSIDTRTIGRGEIFFALKGEHTDGHHHLPELLRGPALGAVVSRGRVPEETVRAFGDRVLVVVDDPLRALGELARARRGKFPIPLVGVTGSNGKTTTKEMIFRCLSTARPTFRNPGNFNNLIGLPLALMGLAKEHEFGVVEMGMSYPGEIRRLKEIAAPDMGVLTNIAPTHLETMKSVERIFDAKFELFEGEGEGFTAIVNGDDPVIASNLSRFTCPVLTFGLSRNAEVRPERVEMEGGIPVLHMGDGSTLRSPLAGRHNVYNLLAAVAVARRFGIDWKAVRIGLEGFEGIPGRMESITVGEIAVLNDAYNSNPVSLRESVDTLLSLSGQGKRIAVVGDMLELGAESVRYHREAGEYIGSKNPDYLITLGELACRHIAPAAAGAMGNERVIALPDHDSAARMLASLARDGDVVLLKGSRGIEMEKILLALRRLMQKGNPR